MDLGPLVPNNPNLREIQSPQGLDLTRRSGPQFHPELRSHESALNESLRVLIKRKRVVLSCLVAIFSVVTIATLKMTPVYEASGTIEINKPDTTLAFQNSGSFSLDYYDPTELDTEVKILQSDLLALQVIRELNLDHSGGASGQAPSLEVTPDPPEIRAGRNSGFALTKLAR